MSANLDLVRSIFAAWERAALSTARDGVERTSNLSAPRGP
jgi:hypothetical protein